MRSFGNLPPADFGVHGTGTWILPPGLWQGKEGFASRQTGDIAKTLEMAKNVGVAAVMATPAAPIAIAYSLLEKLGSWLTSTGPLKSTGGLDTLPEATKDRLAIEGLYGWSLSAPPSDVCARAAWFVDALQKNRRFQQIIQDPNPQTLPFSPAEAEALNQAGLWPPVLPVVRWVPSSIQGTSATLSPARLGDKQQEERILNPGVFDMFDPSEPKPSYFGVMGYTPFDNDPPLSGCLDKAYQDAEIRYQGWVQHAHAVLFPVAQPKPVLETPPPLDNGNGSKTEVQTMAPPTPPQAPPAAPSKPPAKKGLWQLIEDWWRARKATPVAPPNTTPVTPPSPAPSPVPAPAPASPPAQTPPVRQPPASPPAAKPPLAGGNSLAKDIEGWIGVGSKAIGAIKDIFDKFTPEKGSDDSSEASDNGNDGGSEGSSDIVVD